MKILIRHARQVAFCSCGMRYFAEKHNLDFLRFVREGLDEEELRATGDQTALMAIEAAYREVQNGGIS